MEMIKLEQLKRLADDIESLTENGALRDTYKFCDKDLLYTVEALKVLVTDWRAMKYLIENDVEDDF